MPQILGVLCVLSGCGRVSFTRVAIDSGASLDAARVASDAGGAGPQDASTDGPIGDAGPDADAPDAAGPPDAGSLDAGSPDAGPPDAGPPDAGSPDAGSPDAGPPDAGGTTTIECVPVVPPNELNSAMNLDADFWPGFRFQITAPTTAIQIGMNVENRGVAGGTVFGAIIALTGMSDDPDSASLATPDVLATTIITLGALGASHTVTGPMATPLTPGWYALMFGTGAFGATATSAMIHSNSGGGGCTSGGGYPFTDHRSAGTFGLQGATPNFFIVTAP